MVISFLVKKDINPRLAYVINFLDNHPLKPKSLRFFINHGGNVDKRISYDLNFDADLYIPSQKIMFTTLLEPLQFECNKYLHNDRIIFSVERDERKSSQLLVDKKTFGFDILETIFFHISRYEEYVSKQNNPKNSWLYEEKHFLVQHKLEKQPIVDELVRCLFEIISGEKIEKKTTYSLSHDIDVLYRYRPRYKILRSVFAMMYHRRGWKHFIKSMRQVLSSTDPYDVYDWLIRSENHFLSKRIYFMAGGETTKDNLYDINHSSVQELIKIAQQKGYQISLHPSYNAAFKSHLFVKEKKRLEQVCGQKITASRQHWLNFSWTKTPKIIRENDIHQDSSLGYSARIGFRCGTGYEYYLYDFKTEKRYDWSELPLAYMESSLIHEAEKTGKSIQEISKTFLAKNKWNTHIEMNWHNSNFDTSMWYGEELKQTFQTIVDLK